MQVLIIDNDIAYRNGVSMAASNKHLAAFDIYDHSCVTRNITAIQAVRGSCSGWLFNSFLAEQNIIRCMCSCFNVLESTSGKSAAGF